MGNGLDVLMAMVLLGALFLAAYLLWARARVRAIDRERVQHSLGDDLAAVVSPDAPERRRSRSRKPRDATDAPTD